jgi:hypothetical protein
MHALRDPDRADRDRNTAPVMVQLATTSSLLAPPHSLFSAMAAPIDAFEAERVVQELRTFRLHEIGSST